MFNLLKDKYLQAPDDIIKARAFIAEQNFILEGLNSRIHSARWIASYDSGVASDMFYLMQ
jgi:hypothetical protein